MSKKFTAIVSLILAICAIVALASVPVSADAEATPVLSIEAASLSLTQNVAINYYVKADNVGDREVDLLLYKSAQDFYDPDEPDYVISTHITSNIGGVNYLVFQANDLSAAMMGDDFYAIAHCGGYGEPDYVSAPVKYSVLRYYKEMRNQVDEATGKALDAMLAYGAAVQEMQNYKTDALVNSADLCYVKVKDGKFADKANYAIVKAGTEVTMTANNKFNSVFSGWRIAGTEEIISDKATYTATVTGDTVYEAVYTTVISYMGYDFSGKTANGSVSATARNSAGCVIGFTVNNGLYTGTATGYPFRGTVTVDAAAGSFTLASPNGGTVYHSNATVDAASGLIIAGDYYGNANSYILLVPVKALEANGNAVAYGSDVKVSAWNGNVTILSYDGMNIAIIDGNVTFGVDFVGKDGSAIAANEAFNHDYIAIKKDGAIIAAYAKSNDKFVANAHCIHANDTYYFINANGSASVGDVPATATAIDDNTYSVKTSNKNYTVDVLNGTAVENNVTITLANTDLAAIVTAKDIAISLPSYTPADATKSFAGWCTDEACTNVIDGDYMPTADATVYAKIVTKVTVNFVIGDGIRMDPIIVSVPEGATLADAVKDIDLALDANGINIAACKKFGGWSFDGEILEADAAFSAEDEGLTIIGSWTDVPAYYGNYKGTEIWGNTSGNSSSINVSINENGVITGHSSAAGTITAYDPATGKITNGNKYYIGFDAASGILVFNYSSNVNDYGTDCYIVSKFATANKFDAAYALGCIDPADKSKSGYYAHFVVIETANGKENALIYGTDIYAGITLKTSDGADVNVATIKDVKTLCVYNAAGDLICAFATTATNFAAGNGADKVKALDPYFGSYTNGGDTITLDGTGIITCGEKTGTYAVAPAGSDYGFDVYLANNTEYYKLTLDGANFTMVKPMVTITFVSDKTAVEPMTVNANVAIDLPAPENDNFVFRGWFLDDAFANAAENAFAADTTVYAKWLEKVTVTVHDNLPGSEAVVKVYGKGEIPSDIADPAKIGLTFMGWFTDAAFTAGNEFTNADPVNASCEIYAKWEEAPAFNRDYNGMNILNGTTTNGGSNDTDDRTGWIKIDSKGNAKGSSWPVYNKNISVVYTDKAAGLITMTIDSTTYNGIIDNDTGVMLIYLGSTYYFMVPDISASTYKSKISTSYWAGGKVRVLSYIDGDVNVTFFANDGIFYKDVTFVDDKNNTVAGKDAYKTTALYIKNADGDEIYSAGYNGTTMVAFDGTQGTYTAGDDTLVLYGTGKASLNGGETFDCTKISDNVISFYADGAYYEVTLDYAAKTATIVAPAVTVTYVSAQTAVDPESKNKNIAFTLPVPTADAYTFIGWFFDEGFTMPVGTTYVPTADITLYAKWVDKVQLTIHVGNGLDDIVLNSYESEAINLANYKPAYTDGKYFTAFCTDAACENALTSLNYTMGNANADLYVLWTEGLQYTILNGKSGIASNSATSDPWSESNGEYVSTIQGKSSGKQYLCVSFNADGVFTFSYNASSESNYDLLFACYNASSASKNTVMTQLADGTFEKSGLIAQASGEGNTYKTMSVTVKAGDFITFIYSKDGSGDKGSDCAWVKDFSMS